MIPLGPAASPRFHRFGSLLLVGAGILVWVIAIIALAVIVSTANIPSPFTGVGLLVSLGMLALGVVLLWAAKRLRRPRKRKE
jgi:hypothetical protein